MTIWTLGQNIGQKLLRTFSRLPRHCLLPGLLLAGVCAAQSSVTMTFEGLKDAEPVGQYYNGGLGLLGSGPGPNFGVDFGNSVMVATLDKSNGGSGDFSGNPSGNEIAYFPGGTPVTMNVPAGFSGGISLYYSNVLFTATVTVFSGLNGTGGVLATLPLSVNGAFCNGSSSVNSCWTAAGVSFSGQALSVVFSANAQAGIVGIDNLTLGSVNAPSSTITSLSPSSAAAGSSTPVALTINGTGFASGAVVHWTPTGGQTTNLSNVQVVSNSVITATIPSALLATAGAVQVVVVNPTGGASLPATFTISGGATAPVTLTFEGLKDQEPVGNYYIGQVAGSGSGPGPNLGVSFGTNVVASIAKSAGGTGDFTGNPSGKTVATVVAGNGNGNGQGMNVSAGFTTGFSFYYSAPTTAGFIEVRDGLNGTGNILATVQLPATGTNCNGSTATYSCWVPMGVAFSGVAFSVIGSVTGFDFDNVTFAGVAPPATTISALSPASANVGSAASTLTISGTGFVSGAGVRWTPSTGQPVLLSNVQVVSSSSLTASVPASLLAAIGTAQVFVTSPTGADSLPATFAVNSATATSATLTFEGLKTDEPIMDFYNGGLGGQGSGPGPNFGVSFGPDALGSISVTAGGSGTFDRNPSGITTAYFVSGPGVLMNVAAGFTNGFSVYYASGTNTGFVQVFDGLNGTGNILATLQLPATGANCDQLYYSCWSTAGTTFTGVAKSVNFSGTANEIGFDNITIGSSVPAGATITLLTPASAQAGSSSVSLSIAGTGFAAGASVMWTPTGGQPTTLSNVVVQSGGLLTATIPTTLLGIPGTAQVVVANLAGGSSAPAIFTITGVPPTITTLTPSTITAQAANLNLTIDGTGFASGAIVQWIAKGQTTLLTSVQFVSATRLTTVIPGGLLAAPGSAQISVVNPNGGTSAGAAFSITGTTITPAITSLSPSGATVQTTSLTVTINGSNFVNGATLSVTTPTGTVTGIGVTFVSSTQLTAVIAGSFLTAPVVANIVVTNPNGAASNAFPFAVTTNTVSITTISPATVPVQVANLTLTINGSGFVTGSTAQWIVGSVSTALTGIQVVSATQMTATVAGVLLSAAGSARVTVTNPTGSPSNAVTFTITAPTPIPATVGTASTITSPTDQPALTLNLGSPPPGAPVTGTAVLTFTPDPTVKGVQANYIDPAAKFSTGTTFTFTIPAGCSLAPTGCPGTVVWPGNGQFAQGTVAGTLTVTVTALNSAGVSVLTNPPPQLVVTVQPLAPVITLGSVKITNVTSTGFNVALKGYSTTREVTGATFTFAAASGANLTGAGTPITVSFNGLDQSQWFTTAAGQQAGSNFSLSVAFAYTGDTSAIGSVTVTLNSSRGTSGAVTGTQ